jgi:hypothetical protein
MRKLYFIAIIYLSLTSTTSSQEGWFWQNPLPQGNFL